MPNPAVRTVVISWVNSAMAGDELLELWLKTAGSWALSETIPVASIAEQSHEFGFAPGAARSLQIRAKRDGVYRAGYDSTDPEDWPSGSRLDFTCGMPTGVLAFTGWARTSGVAHHLSFSFSNVDPARETKFYRDDGGGFDLIGTIAAGTSTYDYAIQSGEEATTLAFKITQANDDAVETPSNTLNVFAGPLAPTNLDTLPSSPGYSNVWYGYDIQWVSANVLYSTKVQDNYCGAFQTRATEPAGIQTKLETGLTKFSAASPNGNLEVMVDVRIRHEYTSFAVTDVSDWTELDNVPVDIAPDETAYGSC